MIRTGFDRSRPTAGWPIPEEASSMTVYAVMTTIVVSLLIGAASRPVAAALPSIAGTPSYSNLTGRVVLDDERVLVQAFRRVRLPRRRTTDIWLIRTFRARMFSRMIASSFNDSP
jgi:hypothetical protein